MKKESLLNSGILGCSAGLLISMALRKDDCGISGFDLKTGDKLTEDQQSVLQIKALRQAALDYQKFSKLIEASGETPTVDAHERLAILEILGKGFFRPEFELVFRSWVTDDALIEACRLASEKPEYNGIVPNITIEDASGTIDKIDAADVMISLEPNLKPSFPNEPRVPSFDLVFDGSNKKFEEIQPEN